MDNIVELIVKLMEVENIVNLKGEENTSYLQYTNIYRYVSARLLRKLYIYCRRDGMSSEISFIILL